MTFVTQNIEAEAATMPIPMSDFHDAMTHRGKRYVVRVGKNP